MSTYIKKVVFHLHPTLQPPSRTVETAPFEVTEQGWGEFEISLQVFFHDSKKPVELSTMLKLYPDGDANAPQNPAKPVVSERYDEFVFNHPSEGCASVSPRTSSLDQRLEDLAARKVVWRLRRRHPAGPAAANLSADHGGASERLKAPPIARGGAQASER